MSDIKPNPEKPGLPASPPPPKQPERRHPWTWAVVVLILAGIQMLGIGLLGELQVRHFHTPSHRAPYAIDRILRLRSSEESLLQ